MSTATSAAEQIEELQQQIERLKDRSILELRVKLAEARGVVADLEAEIQKMTGEEKGAGAPRTRKQRTSVTIADVVKAINAGATNYRAVATKLGATAATVAKKIKAEGKEAGISSIGQKAAFKLLVK